MHGDFQIVYKMGFRPQPDIESTLMNTLGQGQYKFFLFKSKFKTGKP